MIPGFGKSTVTIGSSPDCEIRLGGAGVAPHHAQIVAETSGQLFFVDLGSGPSQANQAPVVPKTPIPFDFVTQFVVGHAPVPNAHPAVSAMLMRPGRLPPAPGQLVLGRDPDRVHLVLIHPNVSGLHATLNLEPLAIVDHGSTAGTYLSGVRLAPQQPVALDPQGTVNLGPIPLLVSSLRELALHKNQFSGVPAPAPPPPLGPTPEREGGDAPDAPRRKHKTVIGQVSFGPPDGAKLSVKSIGRTPDNDIPIAHPQVSSRHALLHRIGDQLFLEDRGSANGTYVRGQRIPGGQRVPVQNGEKVFIGPMPLLLQVEHGEVAVVLEDAAQWEGRPLYEIEAWDLVMEVPDRDNPGVTRTLLDHVSFKALPGDLIALMGPSGAGKTTLLLTLNGYTPPTAGQVRINGEDLYSIYDALRGSIGYVPQDDIVHPELTVWEAVRYSAKMRLPPDYSDEEIDRRVQTTLAQLGLESVAHLMIGRPEKKILSGGQRKRVNIAMELVTDPVLLFLDEPTSGLAADDTTALVQLLSDLARQTGKTIITTIHQPARHEYEKFNLALIMGAGGIPIYFGPTRDGYRFFGSWLERQGKPNTVDNPRDMFDMLNQRERPLFEAMRAADPAASRFAARQQSAREWNAEFFAPTNPVFQQMYSGRRAVGAGTSNPGIPPRRGAIRGQLGLLLSRYGKIKLRDASGTSIMLLQAPIIGLILALVFGGQTEAIPYWCLGALQELARRAGGATAGDEVLSRMPTTTDNSAPLFFLVVAAVWFGTSNAAREIVAERAIYLRERMVNLRLVNYVFSKFLFLSLVCVVQCAILLGIAFFALGFNGGLRAFGIELAVLIITSMASTATGLLLSTMVTSSEAAMSLTPIALIPQVILGGLMVPMTTNPYLKWPMMLMPARWGFEGVVAQERVAIAGEPAWVTKVGEASLESADSFISGGKFECALAQVASTDLNGAWGFTTFGQLWVPFAVLGGMLLAQLLAILIILRHRDSV